MKKSDAFANTILGDVSIDQEKVQNVIEAGIEGLSVSTQLQVKLIERTRTLIEAKQSDDPMEVIHYRMKMSRADNDVMKNLDLLFRLNEFAQGNADSRPDSAVSSRKLLEGLPDHLLKAIMDEHRKKAEAEEPPKGLLQ